MPCIHRFSAWQVGVVLRTIRGNTHLVGVLAGPYSYPSRSHLFCVVPVSGTAVCLGSLVQKLEDRTVTQLSIPEGLLGFEASTEFELVEVNGATDWWWLRSLEDPELKFLVVDPFTFFPDYDFDLSVLDTQRLGVSGIDDVAVLCVVTTGKAFTANLAGPVVVNARTFIAYQVVLEADLPLAAPLGA